MVKCSIVRIEDGKDQFSLLLENMTGNDINQLCYALAQRTEEPGSEVTDSLFTAINRERLKE